MRHYCSDPGGRSRENAYRHAIPHVPGSKTVDYFTTNTPALRSQPRLLRRRTGTAGGLAGAPQLPISKQVTIFVT